MNINKLKLLLSVIYATAKNDKFLKYIKSPKVNY